MNGEHRVLLEGDDIVSFINNTSYMNTEILTNSENNAVSQPQKEQTYYTIQNAGIVFQGMVQRRENLRSYTIIDTSGKDCVKITIDDGDPEKEYFLGGLSYRASCSIHPTLIRGAGTAAMIRAAVCFATHMNPDLEYIVFADDSYFDCKLRDEDTYIRIPLHTHNFLLYGKTWYQRMFGAEPADTGRWVSQLDISRQALLQTMDTADYLQFPTSNITTSDSWVIDAKKSIHTLFLSMKSRSTHMDFLQALFGRSSELARLYGNSAPCTLFTLMQQKLIDAFVVPFLQMTQWKITRSTILAYPDYAETLIEHDPHPVHVKENETIHTSRSRFSYLFNTVPYFTEGGGETRRNRKNRRYIPGHYAGLRGYLTYPIVDRYKSCTKRKKRCIRQ